MSLVIDTWFQLVRHLKMQSRMKMWILVSLVQPIIWLVLFTQVFTSLSTLPDLEGASYLQFFAPGVIVMTVMFGSSWAGMGLLQDMDMGILDKMMATPVTRLSILLARVLASMTMLLIQALVILGIAVIMGVQVMTGLPGLIVMVVLVSLLGLGFAAFSSGVAMYVKRPEPLVGVVNFIALPTVFLSSAMMPPNLLPEWLDTMRKFNPLDYAVTGVRDLVLNGWVWPDLLSSLAVLSVWAVMGTVFGMTMFRFRLQ